MVAEGKHVPFIFVPAVPASWTTQETGASARHDNRMSTIPKPCWCCAMPVNNRSLFGLRVFVLADEQPNSAVNVVPFFTQVYLFVFAPPL